LGGSASSNDVFSFVNEAGNQQFAITGYHVGDELYMANQTQVNFFLANQTVGPTGVSVTLQDGTQITLLGYTTKLTSSDFGHP
jgi:hypothetical protein